MKRSFKNTIMIGMAAVLIGTSAVTISYAATATPRAQPFAAGQTQQGAFDGAQGNPIEGFGNQQGGQTPQDNQGAFPFDSQQSDSAQQNEQQNGQQAQDKTQENADSNQAPAAPDQKQEENSTPPSGRNSVSDEAPSVTNTAKGNFRQMQPQRRGGTVIAVLCYLFAALQIGIVAAIALWLVMSKMNKLSFQKTLCRLKQ